MHRDCSNSTARWRSLLCVWVPVPGKCTDKSEWVKMPKWGGRKEGRLQSEKQEGDIGEDVIRFWGTVFLLFSLSHRNTRNLYQMSKLLQLSLHRLPLSLSSRSLQELLQWLDGDLAPAQYVDENWLCRGCVLSCALHLWSVSQGKSVFPFEELKT